jgi:hypothetical protein
MRTGVDGYRFVPPILWTVIGRAFARPGGFAHSSVCELICFARKHDLDHTTATNQHDGQISQNLSSHSRKNIPLPPQAKSAT